jgi:magnesium-transporting ATPase (P-type)
MEPATVTRHAALFEAAALCHNVRRVNENNSPRWLGDPMEVALVEMAERAGTTARRERVDEVPFDADRRRMSTVHEGVSGRVLYCKGAPESVLPLCRDLLTAEGIRALTAGDRAQTVRAQEAMAAAGLRVLAFASRALPAAAPRERWEEELVLAGLIGLEDPPRPEVPAAIEKCHAAGIKVIMVTGDHPHTARAIAREIGLARDPVVMLGDALRRLTDTQLQLTLDAPDILFARVTADQKLRIVEALQRKQHVVAVTGDGVNDASRSWPWTSAPTWFPRWRSARRSRIPPRCGSRRARGPRACSTGRCWHVPTSSWASSRRLRRWRHSSSCWAAAAGSTGTHWGRPRRSTCRRPPHAWPRSW